MSKKSLKKFFNIFFLVVIIVGIIVVAVTSHVPTWEAKGGVITLVLLAVKTTLPQIRKQVDDAIDKSDIPDDEGAK